MANTEHHRYSEIDEIIPGKGGWSGREGQPPGSSKIVMHINPKRGGGGGVLGGGGAPAGLETAGGVYLQISLDFPALGSHSPADGGRCKRPVPDNSGDVLANDTPKVPTSVEVKRFLLGAAWVCLNGGCDLLRHLGHRCRKPQWGAWM